MKKNIGKSTGSNNLDVLLINPHLEFPKDTSGRSDLYRSKEFLLNMGLLSIATYLKNIGVSVEMCDLAAEDNPKNVLETLMLKHKPKIVGISNQSCYSYLAIMEYANIIKSVDNRTKIVVGGLHASGIPDVVLEECGNIDVVVVGEGELVLADIVRERNDSGYKKTVTAKGQSILRDQRVPDLDIMPTLDYALYPSYQEFVPYVEESRGCSAKCTYCISPLVNRGIRIRQPENIVADIVSLRNLYGHDGFHLFLEANNFAVNHKRVEILAKMLAGSSFSWRTESRVDTFPIHLLDSLVSAGLRVLDIGLESGSPEMLMKMNKTKSPKAYLDTCLKLAEQVAKNGKCLLKLNVMLFYGESNSSIKSTVEYLRLISSICPISIGIGPVRMDPGSEMYRIGTEKMDLSRFDETFWGKVHCYPIDLSEEISFKDANRICLEISQEFQTSKAYYEAKRHSQLRYDISYDKFMAQSESIPANERQWRY